VAESLPHWFRKHGYQTVSVGKVSHHPGGRGGARWENEERQMFSKVLKDQTRFTRMGLLQKKLLPS